MQRTPASARTKKAWRAIACIGALSIIALVLLEASFNASSSQVQKALVGNHVHLRTQAGYLELQPAAVYKSRGLIFYAGAFVDSHAYIPELAPVAAKTHTAIYIVTAPLKLAVLNSNEASYIMRGNPKVTAWYVGGHSLGGRVACDYAFGHPSRIAGVMLLGAYCYHNADLLPRPIIVLAGANDRLISAAKVRSHLHGSYRLTVVPGASHASFGSYGKQPFDGTATATLSVIDTYLTQAFQSLIAMSTQTKP